MSREALQDRLRWFSSPADLREPIIHFIDFLSQFPAHFRILTAGLGFILLARGAGMDPHELLSRIIRMEKDFAAAYAKQAHAMQAYAENELEC